MALNFIRLARLTMDRDMERRAQAQLQAFGGGIQDQPMGYTFFLHAADFALGPSHEVVVAGDPAKPDTQAMLKALRTWYLPRTVVVLRLPGEAPPITQLAPWVKDHRALGGQATAYVCENFACRLPTTDLAQMRKHLGW